MDAPFRPKRFFHASLLAFLALACQKEATPSERNESAPAPVTSAAERAAPAPPASSVPRSPAFETPFAGQDQRVGKYVETSAYKFRVDTVVRCADPAPDTLPPDRKIRVAAKVGIFSKYDQFFVSPRDVSLEKDGVVIDSERGVKTGAECAPLLEQKYVNHDTTLEGFVVFHVPDEAFARGAVVAFHPTRWGGAPRTEITIEPKDFVAGKAGAKPATK
jgi:hypothetical protein